MRLIDADALPKYTGYALSADEVAMAVENAPTIDAVPVRHGRWEAFEDMMLDTCYRCSECGREFYLEGGTPQENEYNYCPNCGAKMDYNEWLASNDR